MDARLTEAVRHLTSSDSLSLARMFPEWDIKVYEQRFDDLGPLTRTHEVVVDNVGTPIEREVVGELVGIEKQEKDLRSKCIPNTVVLAEIALRCPTMDAGQEASKECNKLFNKQQAVLREIALRLDLIGTKVHSHLSDCQTVYDSIYGYYTRLTRVYWDGQPTPLSKLRIGMCVVVKVKFHRMQYRVYDHVFYALVIELIRVDVLDPETETG